MVTVSVCTKTTYFNWTNIVEKQWVSVERLSDQKFQLFLDRNMFTCGGKDTPDTPELSLGWKVSVESVQKN